LTFSSDLEEKAARLQALHQELSKFTVFVDTNLQEKEHVAEELEHVRQTMMKQQEG
jgi:chaperonin cofactor prefoldin